MKKITVFLICLVSSVALFAQEKMYIHTNGNTLGAPISGIDSIYFANNGSTIYFDIDGTITEFGITEIDSISFGENSETVIITYNGNSATVINPFAFEGVSITIAGADVVVNSTLDDQKIDYKLTGSTSNGMFKLYGDYKFNLILNGVDITNADGPAINIQSGKKCDLILEDGTTNSLSDGSTYADSEEDQKGTFFSEGQIIFQGTGSLTVNSSAKHAICSDDYISVEEGTITVSGAAKDGIHTNDYFEMIDGTLSITSTGDGIDGDEGYIVIAGGDITITNESDDVKGISCDSTISINGGTINMTIDGNQSKGIKSGQTIYLNGGDITINTSGAAVLESSGSGYDPSYCSAIKCDGDIYATGTNITIKATGKAGKGISCDGNANISGGTVKITTTGSGSKYTNSNGESDAYVATGISTDVNLNIIGGAVTISSSGSGGKGISVDGALTVGETGSTPSLAITTSGSEIVISNSDAAESKAVKADGNITFTSGTTTISSADDGIKSEANIYLNGGNITISKSYEAVEAPYIYVSGAYVDVTASNDAVNATKGTGSESNDGSWLYVTGGTLIATCTGGDVLDSNGNITISDGLVIVNGVSSGDGEAVDLNGTLLINGGIVMTAGIAGPTGGTSSGKVSSSSTQPCIELSTNSQVSSSTFIDIRIGSTDVITFKPKNGGTRFIFSSPNMTKGASYTIYTGGSYSKSTNMGGYYTDGTYTPGTVKKSGTLSSSSTVNSISF